MISIIIPTYNRPNELIECLDSLIKQGYTKWECIVVDDGSTLNNFEKVNGFIKNFTDRIYLFRRPDYLIKGPSSCRNYGLKKAKGNYIQFFDDDDEMYPNMLKEKFEEIEKTKADVVVAPLDFYDINKKKITHQNTVFSKDIITDYVLSKISWYVSGPLWRKDFLTEMFDETIQTLDDWDFNLRNIYKNPKVVYLKNTLQKYNQEFSSNKLSVKARLGDEKQLTSSFLVYKKHYLLLNKKGLLHKRIHLGFMNYFNSILRLSLQTSISLSGEVFDFMKKQSPLAQNCWILRVYSGYYSYKYLKRGYRILKMEIK
jgi:glycosyltransferase involved in cell wall biosynthesis